MEELFRVTNEYYSRLESFKAHGAFKNLYFLGVLISAIMFITFSVFLLQEIIVQKIQNIYSLWFLWFLLAIGSEFLMLFMMNKLRDKKEQNFIKTIETQTGIHCKTLEEAKVELLKNYFSCEQIEFSDLAEKIIKMLNIACQFSNDKSQIEKFFSFIYNSEANSRILTLFVLMCSIIIVLTVNTGQNLYTVMDSFSGSNWGSINFLYLFFIFLVVVLGFGISQVFSFAQKVLIFVSLIFLGKTTRNVETVKYMIRDLNNYHIFHKTKDKKIIINVNKT